MASIPNEIAAGSWVHNPVTGELICVRVAPATTGGRLVEADMWLQPGAAVAAPHVHDHLTERFEVLKGEVGFHVAGAERAAGPDAGVLEVAPGTVHDWWNAGTGVSHVRVEVEAAAGAPGRPAARFVGMIEAMFSLGALGRVNGKGMPGPLWLASLAHEYRDVIRLTRPPAIVQSLLFPPLAALARRTGRDPLASELHGAEGACSIPAPSDEEFHEMLSRPAGPQ